MLTKQRKKMKHQKMKWTTTTTTTSINKIKTTTATTKEDNLCIISLKWEEREKIEPIDVQYYFIHFHFYIFLPFFCRRDKKTEKYLCKLKNRNEQYFLRLQRSTQHLIYVYEFKKDPIHCYYVFLFLIFSNGLFLFFGHSAQLLSY